MAGTVIAVAGGVAVVLLWLWLLRTVVQSERAARRSRDEGGATFVGGLRYHATGGVASGAPNVTWPFALLEIGDGAATISLTRGGMALARAIGLDVDPVTVFRLDEVARVETDFGFTRGLRFRTSHSHDQRDGLVFWSKRRDRKAILDSLRVAGFPLD